MPAPAKTTEALYTPQDVEDALFANSNTPSIWDGGVDTKYWSDEDHRAFARGAEILKEARLVFTHRAWSHSEDEIQKFMERTDSSVVRVQSGYTAMSPSYRWYGLKKK